MSTMIDCNVNGIRCEKIEGTDHVAMYFSQNDGSRKIYIYDRSQNKYIAKGTLNSKEVRNILYDKENYTINYDNGKVSVVTRNPDESSLNTTPSGTYYTTDINGQKITALVVGGVLLALVVGGLVIWFMKNPPIATGAAIGTGETIGGTEAAKIVGSLLDKMGSVLLPIILINNRTEALELFNQASTANAIKYDPVIVDLNGDGVLGTVGVDDGIYFDHQGDGFAEASSWVSKEDGILVIDKNNDGIINDGLEIFGDSYVKSNGLKASSGFDALCDLDSNNDGIINSSDENFSLIKILKGDGSLISLDEAGIVSINLSSNSVNSVDENGNTLVSLGSFVREDGSVGSLGDFNLVVDKMNSFGIEWLDESEEISALPEILGSGEVYSLHQAMVRDESGALKELVEDFIEAEGESNKKNIVKQILYKWTGADSVEEWVRGNNINAKKLCVLEKFIGRGFRGIDGSSSPNNNAGNLLNSAFEKLVNNIYASLMSQTEQKYLFDKLEIEIDEETNVCKYSLNKVISYIDNLLVENKEEGKALLSSFSQNFINLGLKEQSNYQEFYNHYTTMDEYYGFLLDISNKMTINGTDEADNIEGTAQDEAIFGGGGDDTIFSRQGNDVVYGGDGNDSIDTCEGDDLIFGGDGNDTIDGGTGTDTIYGGNGDDYLTSKWNSDIYGEGGNDTIYITNISSHFIDGGDGDDSIRINQEYGTNVIVGGKGDDSIYVSRNHKTTDAYASYKYNLGDGNDTISSYKVCYDVIEFGEGITKENMAFRGDGADLIISFKNEEGSIRIKDAFSENYGIEVLKFADGTRYTRDEYLNPGMLVIEGTDGDDSIKGSDSSDLIYGHEGNDTIDGWFGYDTIYGGDGDDSITSKWHANIYGEGGNDSIEVRATNSIHIIDGGDGDDTIKSIKDGGYTTITGGRGDDSIYVSRNGKNNVYAEYRYNLGDGNDTIRSYDACYDVIVFGEGITKENTLFSYENNDIVIKFKNSEGSIRLQDAVSTSYNKFEAFKFSDGTSLGNSEIATMLAIKGTSGDDSIKGTNYSETIYGLAGNDFIDGWYGNDVIYGGDGDDYLHGNFDDDTVYGGNGNDTIANGINNGSDYLYGEAGDDFFRIYSGDDTVIGGIGDDSVQCKASGNNTYIYNIGDGNDTINEYGGNDVIQFGEGITRENMLFSGEGNDLIASFKNSEGSIRINGAISDENKVIETFKFSDGTVLTHDEVVEMVNAQNEQINGVSELLAFEDDKSVSDGIISTSDINKIIQDMTAYKTMEDVVVSYSDDINNEKELMTLVGSGV